MAKVVHFEIYSKNIDKARDFFTKVFDWSFDRWGGPKSYWLLKTDDENAVKATILEKSEEPQSIVNTIEVDSVEQTLLKVKENGGKVLVGKTSIESVGYIAYFTDIDGNVFGIVEKNTLAK